MAETINLGIVGIKNMGEYDAETNYEKLNVVTYQGSSYCALKDTVGNLPTNDEYWQLYAQKGDKGNTGNTGPQGPKPVKGVDYYTNEDIADLESTLASDVSEEVTEQLGGLVSATPLVASDVSGMTDTTRVYVNTTDGNWYYYDGDSWEIGGVYQATSDHDNVTKIDNAVFNVPFARNSGIEPRFGHINSLGGITANDNKDVCFKSVVYAGAGSTISTDAGYKYQYALHNAETGAFIERITWKTSSEPTTLAQDYFIRIEVTDSDETVQEDFSAFEHLHYNLITNNVIMFQDGATINSGGNIGDVINTTPTETTGDYYKVALVDCKQNDEFIINVTGGTNPRAWAFLDSDNKLLALADVSTAEQPITNLKLTAPKNASKLILNDHGTNTRHPNYYLDNITSNRHAINLMSDFVIDLEEDLENHKDFEESIEQCNNIVIGVGLDTFIEKTLAVIRPKEYRCWPFIGYVNKKLICLYSHGIAHEGSPFDVVFKTSENGVLWEREKVLFHEDNTRINVTGKGYNSYGDILIWKRIGIGTASFSLYKTSDGENFTKVCDIANNYGHIGDIINIPNTTNLIAFFNGASSGNHFWGVLKSPNNGASWEEVIIESDLTNENCPTEISPVYLGNGKILAMGRKNTSTGTNAMFQIQSSDDGLTWTKQYTNITDIALSTPSILVKDNVLSLYYFQRGAGNLRLRQNNVNDIWNNPTNWSASRIISKGTTYGEDTGNVNACQFNDYQIATYYSGNPTNTGIYSVME